MIFKVFAKIVFLLFPCIFGPKNLPKTLPKQCLDPLKIDAKNCLFFNFDFLGFWPRFGSLLGLQVRRAACSARRVRPYCIFAFQTYCICLLRGGQELPNSRPNGVMSALCWHMFRSWAPFFRSWLDLERFLHFSGSCWSFFSGFGSLRTRFWMVASRFWNLQNHI